MPNRRIRCSASAFDLIRILYLRDVPTRRLVRPPLSRPGEARSETWASSSVSKSGSRRKSRLSQRHHCRARISVLCVRSTRGNDVHGGPARNSISWRLRLHPMTGSSGTKQAAAANGGGSRCSRRRCQSPQTTSCSADIRATRSRSYKSSTSSPKSFGPSTGRSPGSSPARTTLLALHEGWHRLSLSRPGLIKPTTGLATLSSSSCPAVARLTGIDQDARVGAS
jgi:hypothetical protein